MPDWKNLPPIFPRAALHPAAVAEADKREGEPWTLALSGGSDSIALLLVVLAHWPQSRSRLTALHFNHCLRGAESDGDEEFCRGVCSDLGVAFVSEPWVNRPRSPSEGEAREARQRFFAAEMSRIGARVLWTGHQKDDVAETLLMRLARGSGPAGLAAPRPVQAASSERIFLRPLLALGKEELTAALRSVGASWREDATNAGDNFFRNRIRSDVVPAWRAAAPNDALDGAALTRALCEEDDAALEIWLAELKVESTEREIDLRSLAGKPRALLRRALRRWAPAQKLGRAGFEALIDVCERRVGQVSAGDGVLEWNDGRLRLVVPSARAENWAEVTLSDGVSVMMPDGGALRVSRVTFDVGLKQRIFSGAVDPGAEAFIVDAALPLTMRLWQPGDRYQPLGFSGAAKLQDLFVNKKVTETRRRQLPVVCSERGEVLWVPGFGPAEHYKVNQDSVTGVQLTYSRGTSTVAP